MASNITSKSEVLDFFNTNNFFNKKCVVGIDGRCGSGKTTLANELKKLYDIDIISLDDFFLPTKLRTEERLSEIAGNVHYERFLNEVIDGINSGKSFSYKIFSCKSMSYVGSRKIINNKPIIIEGSYSLREEFRNIYDLKIFLKISKNEQKKRIISRNGEQLYENFRNIWIPKEELYFEKFKIEQHSDIVIQENKLSE